MSRSVKLLSCLLGIAFVLTAVSNAAFSAEFIKPDRDKGRIIKRLDSAYNTVMRMRNGLEKDQSLEKIAVGYAQLGKFDRALETVTEIADASGKVTAYVWIARQYNSAGNEYGMNVTLTKALEAAESINDRAGVAHALLDIAATFISPDQTESVNGVLSRALFEAHQLNNTQEKAQLFNDVASAYSSIGLTQQARGISHQATVLKQIASGKY